MEYINSVSKVNNPHLTETIAVVKNSKHEDSFNVMAKLTQTVMIYIENNLTTALKQSVSEHGRPVKIDITKLEDINLENRVVRTCPNVLRYLENNPTLKHAKYVIVDNHAEVDEQLIVVELADTGHNRLVDFNISEIEKETLESDVEIAVKLTVEFFVKSVSGSHYICVES